MDGWEGCVSGGWWRGRGGEKLIGVSEKNASTEPHKNVMEGLEVLMGHDRANRQGAWRVIFTQLEMYFSFSWSLPVAVKA